MTKVLVVDDNGQNRYLLQTLLSGNGYEVFLAADGVEALAMAQNNPPDIIITDILMPGMDGYALCRQWMLDEKLKEIPLVFYTATYTDPKDEQFALSMGAARFIRKPAEHRKFLDAIAEVIQHHTSGHLTPPRKPQLEDTVYLKQYNEALVRKLEDKLVELESANASLERELAERRRAEEHAGRVGREWQATFDATNSAVWILDRDQRVVRSNKTSERIFHHSCKDLIGRHCYEIVHGSEGPVPECPVVRARESLQRESQELQIGDRWYQVIVDPILDADGQYAGAVHLVSDISDHKRTEHDLLASETRYRRLFESAKDGILILDADTGEIVDVNPFLVDLLGFDHEYFLGKKLWGIGPFKDIAASEAAFLELREEEYIRYEDLPLETRDGRRIDVEFVSNVYLVDSRKVIQCNIRDISERKRTAEALKLHAVRVQALLDLQSLSQAREDQVFDFTLSACLKITQSEYSFIGTVNESESTMTIHRWSKEVMEECETNALPLEYPICAAGLWGDSVRERVPVICNDYLAPHPHKKGLPEGHVAIHRFVAVPVLDGNVIVAVAAVANKKGDYSGADVDALSTLLHKMWEILSRQRMAREREALEEQLRQAQKMEAIGQLAGGVAHDFNNILQAIMGYSGMLLKRLPAHDETHDFAEEILHGVQRAAMLTRQLLAFSRRQILEMQDLDLNEVVQGVTKMIGRIIGEDIEFKVLEGHGLGSVHADKGQMEQVLLNLCINARDAMPEGGVVTIETQNVVLDREYCDAHAWASPGPYVLLGVTDTGCGMDTPTQARIFEPFFTTKELGKGTGLGLATVYGIVRQHQGMIQVYSEVGKGTTFKVYLPSLERVASTAETKGEEPPRGGAEIILIAEDDEMLRRLASRILTDAGYTVLFAVDGRDALEMFEKHAAEINLVISDVVMPKMGGKAMYDSLHQQYPRLRFLFMSGYSANATSTAFLQQEGVELIQKPYSPDALLHKVREVLDSRSPLYESGQTQETIPE
ncbi:MAG: response regulator [Candidatus Hydrogenedentales bacterium]|jgi:PAS domain S-box-containing protein